MQILKSFICSCIMIVAVWGVIKLDMLLMPGDSFVIRFVKIIIPAGCGVIVYAVSGYIAGIDAVKNIADKLIGIIKR